MDFQKLIGQIGFNFGGDWDEGGESNVALAERLAAVHLLIVDLHPQTVTTILASIIEDAMHLDSDEAGLEVLHNRVEKFLGG